jgi:hypothetical protein
LETDNPNSNKKKNQANFIVLTILILLLVVQNFVQIPSIISQNLSKYSDLIMKLLFTQKAYGTNISNISFNATTNSFPFNEGFNRTSTYSQHNLVQQGTIFSIQDPFPRHQAEQIAVILPPTENNTVYTGILTFTASKPVEIEIFHRIYDINNITNADPKYGQLMTVPFGDNNSSMAISLIKPNQLGSSSVFALSVPFSGNALALHNTNGDPFVAVYTLTANLEQTKVIRNVKANQSLTSPNLSTKEQGFSMSSSLITSSTVSAIIAMFLPILREATAEAIVKLPLYSFSGDDIAKILVSISPDVRTKVLSLVSPDILLKIKNEISQDKLAEIFRDIPQDKIAQILAKLPSS